MSRTTWPALVLTVLLLTTACAQRGPAGAAPTTPGAPTSPETPTTSSAPSAPAVPAEGLVIEVAHTGGFVTPEMLASRLPLVSVHADGRVITQGPQIAIYPPPALPSLQVQHVDEDAVAVLVGRALRAGVDESADLGSPPVADLPSTRFTVRTRDETYVREVYALGAETPPGPPGEDRPGGTDDTLTPEQRAARAELQALVQELSDPASVLPEDAVGAQEAYVPEAVAGVVTEWRDPQNGAEPQPVPWPGPPLPGEPLEPRLGLSCVLATGEQARAVLDAARTADTLTPWVSEDGERWSVALRPLLPHEEGCTDLVQR
ncbi:hypothetical protein ACH9D2_03250 [Kocuria sp. M4R2S49]|uniref:hypothetical protein n=1 Tax=Kocuria rhizosphaericola TaxID=3376284 RepID=UPI003792396A